MGESQGSGGTQPLPPDPGRGLDRDVGDCGLSGAVDATEPLTCSDSAACESASQDLIGYGTAAISETSPATGASNTISEQRSDQADTNNNSTNFVGATPTPGAANSSGGGSTGTGTPGPLRILTFREIRGCRQRTAIT